MAKILEILDGESLDILIKTIREEKTVQVAVNHEKEYRLHFNGKPVFSFDGCRCGKPEHNAVSGILEHINKDPNAVQWTRKRVASLISFKLWQTYLDSLC